MQHFESERIVEPKKKRSLRKADLQLMALLASRVAASVLLVLVSTHSQRRTHTHTRDQRSVVSTAQSAILLLIYSSQQLLYTTQVDLRHDIMKQCYMSSLF